MYTWRQYVSRFLVVAVIAGILSTGVSARPLSKGHPSNWRRQQEIEAAIEVSQDVEGDFVSGHPGVDSSNEPPDDGTGGSDQETLNIVTLNTPEFSTPSDLDTASETDTPGADTDGTLSDSDSGSDDSEVSKGMGEKLMPLWITLGVAGIVAIVTFLVSVFTSDSDKTEEADTSTSEANPTNNNSSQSHQPEIAQVAVPYADMSRDSDNGDAPAMADSTEPVSDPLARASSAQGPDSDYESIYVLPIDSDEFSRPPSSNASGPLNFEYDASQCTLTPKQFNQLPRERFRSPHRRASTSARPFSAGSGGPPNCTICLDTFENGQYTTRLPCLHMFHTDCVKEWLIERWVHCPICRRSVLENSP